MKHATYGVLVALVLSFSAARTEASQQHRENVLGTSFDMTVVGTSPATTEAAVSAALTEIERLNQLLSRWNAESELSRFNASRTAQSVSAELRRVLGLCEEWRAKTGKSFSCRLGKLTAQWVTAEQAQHLPDRAALRRQALEINRVDFSIVGSSALSRPEVLTFDADGLAKGWIIDRALEKAREAAPKAIGIKIDIGGDARYWGTDEAGVAWRVDIADPFNTRDNAGAIATLELHSRAIASSGHSQRGFEIARKHYSHILDPKDGWPVSYAPAAIVVADDAATADALATALTVMPIRAALDLIESLGNVEAMIVTESGDRFQSRDWHALLRAEQRSETGWPNGFTFNVDYEIPQLDAVNYRRPYLALWISAKDGTPINRLLVLGDSERWLQELPAWWRKMGRGHESAIAGIARPTRRAGRYALAWSGRDDSGVAVKPGEYVLHVEAAREHGAHETLDVPFVLSQDPLNIERNGEKEIGQIKLSFGPSKP